MPSSPITPFTIFGIAPNVLSQVPVRNHPRRLVPVHRVNTALSMVQVTRGVVVCPRMTEPLVRGFGLAFVPLLLPQVNWRVALYLRRGPSASPAVESFVRFAREFTEGRSVAGHQGRRVRDGRRSGCNGPLYAS